MDQKSSPDTKRYWLDEPRNVDKLVRVFYIICAIIFVTDFAVPKHGPFAIEYLFSFYSLYGFIACVVLVLIAKQLRRILMRSEDYYDR